MVSTQVIKSLIQRVQPPLLCDVDITLTGRLTLKGFCFGLRVLSFVGIVTGLRADHVTCQLGLAMQLEAGQLTGRC